jgi:chromosome segregation ATPase
MSDENTERINLNIPADLKERLKQGDDSQTEQLVEALEIYFAEGQSGNRAVIERQIQRYEEKRARGKRMKQDAQDMIEEAESAIRRLNKRLEELEQSKLTYADDLDELLGEMEAQEMAVWHDHPSVNRIARAHDKDTSTVLDDLRDRSDLHKSYFTEGPPDVDDGPEQEYDINVGGPE